MSSPSVSSQRDLLVETGARLFHERGYSATGVRQVAAAADVPLGSFTNHFRSKERFALVVLDHYVARLDTIMRVTLGDTSRPPARRLEAYFDAIESALNERDWGVGCLIPDLATEASIHTEPLRGALAKVLEQQTAAFAAVLNDIVETDGVDDVAAVVLAAWHGTLLRMKVERSGEPVARFRRVLRRLLSA
ncbi:TetR/AcrR family transcriptional regulator [Sphingomonas faeni]|jgi:TetR/AcrR family transcriptional repressor of nem operon|uniref:TetR/AcrR family transcriptional regulator n=1 Tax=Sphingomonas faeni TaxID=185950 RepID=UPI00334F4BC5